jgi:hypothetical protein
MSERTRAFLGVLAFGGFLTAMIMIWGRCAP